jgi:hypothetical protein
MQAGVNEATNPFRFGALALDEAFADRRTEVEELTADAINGQDVVVFAPRRYGKSSLMWTVMRELTTAGVLVAHVDLMKASTKERLADQLAAGIYDNIASKLDRAREKALAPFRGLRITPTVTVDPGTGALSFSFTPGASAEDVDATLERLLQLPAELAADRGRKAVLIIDEFQEIVDLDPQLPNLLRAAFQEQPDVAHLYLGSKRHLMERIFNDENEPFWRSAKQVELGPIPNEPFSEFISERFDQTGKRVDESTVDGVLGLTDGHPYATQELCYALWQQTERRSTAGPAELSDALAGVLRSENAHFTLLWDNATARQRLLLEALAREPGRPFSADYRRRHALPDSSSTQRALEALIQRELVGRSSDGVVRITEPFLAEWITQELSADV